MPRYSSLQDSFNAGEISGLMRARVSQERYRDGLAACRNFLPLVQGPVTRRPGTRFIAGTRANAPARLMDFVFNATQGYVIEATDGHLRFYTNGGQVLDGLGPLDIASPFAAVDLPALDWVQSADEMYIASPSAPLQKLTRTGAASFALEPVTLKGGPFEPVNSDDTLTVYASGGTGTVTLTSSAPIFAATDVDALFRLEQQDFADIPAWEADASVSAGVKRRSDGKAYECIAVAASGKTGTVQPFHSEGEEWDGMNTGADNRGAKWRFLFGPFGIVRITGFTSATQVTGTVEQRLPDGVVGSGNATPHWAHGAFSATRGWPTAVTIWNERLVLAKGTVVYGSVVGGYDDFKSHDAAGLVTLDLAFTVRLANRTVDVIRWLRADQQLVIGTAGGERLLGPLNAQDAPGPGNLSAPSQSYYGSAPVRPVAAHSKLLFVERGQRKLRELGYAFDRDRYVAPDVTVAAEHVTRGGIIDMAYQQAPDSIVWAARADGVLLAFTYSEDERVRGWSVHDAAGVVEALAAIPDEQGEQDELWLVVSRGGDRHVERLEPRFDGGAAEDAFFVAAGLTYRGVPATVISGLAHLNGRPVDILADGATHPQKWVSGGQVTLDRPARVVHVGLPTPAWIETLPLEGGASSGTAQGKTQRISHVTARVHETLGLRFGAPDGPLDDVFSRSAGDAMDAPPQLTTGDIRLAWPAGHARQAVLRLECPQPLPATLLGLFAETVVQA